MPATQSGDRNEVVGVARLPEIDLEPKALSPRRPLHLVGVEGVARRIDDRRVVGAADSQQVGPEAPAGGRHDVRFEEVDHHPVELTETPDHGPGLTQHRGANIQRVGHALSDRAATRRMHVVVDGGPAALDGLDPLCVFAQVLIAGHVADGGVQDESEPVLSVGGWSRACSDGSWGRWHPGGRRGLHRGHRARAAPEGHVSAGQLHDGRRALQQCCMSSVATTTDSSSVRTAGTGSTWRPVTSRCPRSAIRAPRRVPRAR